MITVTAAEMQTMDRQTIQSFGIPGRVLMENAGRGATRCFLQHIYKGTGQVGILAGRGNNGGDGFVIARYLAQKNVDVCVFLLSARDQVQGDAAANLQLLPALEVPIIELPDPTSFRNHQTQMRHMRYWVDAVLGTGLKSEVKGYFRQVIDFINHQQRPVLAVDIPSGLNADTGQPCGACIMATATATFAFPKIGHLVLPGAQYCGIIEVIDIGIPPFIASDVHPRQSLITPHQVRGIIGTRRQLEAHKGSTGHVLVIAGGVGKTGAAAMSAKAAARSGAGLVSLGIAGALNPIMEVLLTEAMTVALPDLGHGILDETAFDTIAQAAQGKICIALGPGIGTAPSTNNLIRRIIKEIDLPVVLDADALNILSTDMACLKHRKSPAILTPHPGEMARLSGKTVADIQQNRVEAARRMAEQHKICVVLKGARTLVAAPDGHVWINPTGNPGMAGGGMGDVLTGVITGLVAQKCPAPDAACAGVYLHGLAADILARKTPWGYLATEVMDAVPYAIEEVISNPPPLPVGFPML